MKISILLLTTTLSFSVLAINPLDETGLQIAEIGEDIIETPVISLHSTGVSAAIISSLFTNARALDPKITPILFKKYYSQSIIQGKLDHNKFNKLIIDNKLK